MVVVVLQLSFLTFPDLVSFQRRSYFYCRYASCTSTPILLAGIRLLHFLLLRFNSRNLYSLQIFISSPFVVSSPCLLAQTYHPTLVYLFRPCTRHISRRARIKQTPHGGLHIKRISSHPFYPRAILPIDLLPALISHVPVLNAPPPSDFFREYRFFFFFFSCIYMDCSIHFQ